MSESGARLKPAAKISILDGGECGSNVRILSRSPDLLITFKTTPSIMKEEESCASVLQIFVRGNINPTLVKEAIETCLTIHPTSEIPGYKEDKSLDPLHFEITTQKGGEIIKYTYFDEKTNGWNQIKITGTSSASKELSEVIHGNSIITLYTGYHSTHKSLEIEEWLSQIANILSLDIEAIVAMGKATDSKKLLRE